MPLLSRPANKIHNRQSKADGFDRIGVCVCIGSHLGERSMPSVGTTSRLEQMPSDACSFGRCMTLKRVLGYSLCWSASSLRDCAIVVHS